jgi:hypothetical protein
MATYPQSSPANEGVALFEKLAHWDLVSSEPDFGIIEWQFEKIDSLIADCVACSPYSSQRSSSSFSFLANSQLGGAPRPCGMAECRARNVGALAQFAALYGDQVLIPDPFSAFLGRRDSLLARQDLAISISLLIRLRPLIEKGLISFAPRVFPLCEQHSQELSAHSRSFRDRLQGPAHALAEELIKGLSYKAGISEGEPFVEISGKHKQLDHVGTVIYGLPGDLKHVIRRSPSRYITGVERSRIVYPHFIWPMLDDLELQNTYSFLGGFRYLTDRAADVALLSAVDDPARSLLSRKLMGALSHTLPVINNISISHLLKLREKEGEAFLVYREALGKVLSLAHSEDESKLRQAFGDLVRPRIYAIDAAVKSARKLVRQSIAEKALIGAGMVSIGVFGGFLPASVGTILAWLGGTSFAVDILTKLLSLVKEPPGIRENEFYFLWKAAGGSARAHT